MASRLTVLYGETGVGKSSVLRAGVAHHLAAARSAEPERARRAWARRRRLRRLARRPVAGAPERRSREAVTHAARWLPPPPEEKARWRGAADVGHAARRRPLRHPRPGQRSTSSTTPERGRPARSPSTSRRSSTRPDLRVNFLLAIREDALAKLDAFKGRIPNVLGNYLRLEHLDPRAARAAIVEPIERYNELVAEDEAVEIEPALVDAVLEQVVAGKVERRPGRARGRRSRRRRCPDRDGVPAARHVSAVGRGARAPARESFAARHSAGSAARSRSSGTTSTRR